MPTPASQPEEQRFASPVPRYSVLPLLSFGSSVRTPTEFWSNWFGLLCFQSGLGDSALFVRHTPPPEAPTQTVQSSLPFVPQLGDTTSAVSRAAVLFVA